jgi:hypothetical protein
MVAFKRSFPGASIAYTLGTVVKVRTATWKVAPPG